MGVHTSSVTVATGCSGCGRELKLAVPVTRERLQDRTSGGEWVRCRCGQINWAREQSPGGDQQ